MTSANPMSLTQIRELLDLLSATVNSFSMVSLEKQLAAAQDLLLENPPIDVAVLGQFKAGKSSFLNSLLGRNLLPVGAIPVTTAITRLQYGERERTRVRHFNPFLAPLINKVKGKLEKDISSWQGNFWKLSRRYESWVSATLSIEMRELSKTEHINFLGTQKKAHASFSRSLEAFCKFLGDNIENVLGVKLAGVDWNIDVVEPDHPDIAFTKSFDVHLDLLWFLIPMFLLRRIFERHFIKGVPKEVEINWSRLAYQWEKSVNNAIDAMRIQAIGYIHEELATIEALLSRTQGQTDDIKRVITQTEKLSGTLSE